MDNDKFRLSELLIRITSRKFLAWIGYMILAFILHSKDGDHSYLDIIAIGAIILTALYMLGDVAADSLAKFISNSKFAINKSV